MTGVTRITADQNARRRRKDFDDWLSAWLGRRFTWTVKARGSNPTSRGEGAKVCEAFRSGPGTRLRGKLM